MAGAALRGMGKVLGKHLKKAPILGKYARTKPKGYPKAGDKWKGVMGPIPPGVKAPKIPEIKKTTRDVGKGAIIAGVAYAAGKAKAKKEAKSKEDKQKLKEALKRQQKETKEKREKHGKHHG